MATRKQRRRELKERRHEYEYVVLDEEGKEVAVEDSPRAKDGSEAPRERQVRDARGRPVDPPSWDRSIKRGGVIGVAIAVVAFILFGRGNTMLGLVYAVIFGVMTIPYMHWIDSMKYKQFQKLEAKRAGEKSGGKPGAKGK